jgi:hypothetical protein
MTNFMCNSLNLVIPSKSIVAKSELHFNDNKIPSTFESGVSNLITPNGCDCIVVGFTTSYAIGAYHH